jgi:omega-hydroxy-beta-dihydromenaquinone-9 sulfotransferase
MTSASSVFSAFDEYQDECDDRGHLPTVKALTSTRSILGRTDRKNVLFCPKFQKSIKNNPFCGICFPVWMSILKHRWRQIEWSVYWPRLLFVTMLSILNSLLGWFDFILYGNEILHARIHPRPVFILGHPRTGTTLLQSLLALDQDRFTTCSTFCAGFPSSFLSIESIGKVLFRGVIDDHRPMDNVPLGFDLPQEDEIATNVMSTGTSPYMTLFFMQQEPEFRPFYAFDDTFISNENGNSDEYLEPSLMAAARKQWTESFLYLLRKLTLRDERRRPSSSSSPPKRRLLLKSPVHTARIPLLLQLFPEAQFIYIHRHPYDVLRSAMHMADTTYWYTYLHTPTDDQIMEFILRQYEILYERYEAGRQRILHTDTSHYSQLIEISFDDLTQQPIETVQNIYTSLGWTMTPNYQHSLQAELAGVQSYQRNRHQELSPDLKQVVNQRWGPSFQRFGYEMDAIDRSEGHDSAINCPLSKPAPAILCTNSDSTGNSNHNNDNKQRSGRTTVNTAKDDDREDLDQAIHKLIQEERHLVAARLLREQWNPMRPLPVHHQKLLTNAEIIECELARGSVCHSISSSSSTLIHSLLFFIFSLI